MRGLRKGLAALAGLGIAAALPSAWALARSARRISTVQDAPATEYALVLGAGVRWDGLPSRILQGRLNVARELFEAGRVRRIIVSGSPESRGHSEPVVMRHHLVSHGIPAAAVVLDESGVDTWASCRRAAEDFGLREVTVVTTRFHLRRAVALCRRAGIDAHGVGHDAAADGLRRVSARGARREFLATAKAFWWRR
ncbi:SanA/YdcF family protein [Saccharopolyspora shandongensis]|uniref:Protein SanA, affects membrane permeability for vancomycin n=1 Tax=Saccharopolyspora shandongensis TaxID=418495 RepID=A0A1H3BSS1_9PSEU|nr:ElyC/SanA/YdcF family protein [Saccharopolyspora shandongensis]SDX44414.1 protein SanA, affects membrane permeability for vancomycin [Saccharopolyspora shandongensis]